MATKDLEPRLAVISSDNNSSVQSLQKRWLLTTSEVQAARMNGNLRFLLMERDKEPKIIGQQRFRSMNILAGNAAVYGIENGENVVYITSPPNNPFSVEDFGKIQNGYVRGLSLDESDAIRRRGKMASNTGVEKFVLLKYPTSTSLIGMDLHYYFFEIYGDGSNSDIPELLMFSNLYGLDKPNGSFRKLTGNRTRIGLFRSREVESYLKNAENGQMVASFVHMRGMGQGSDVYLGGPPAGYIVAKIPLKLWNQWLAQNTNK